MNVLCGYAGQEGTIAAPAEAAQSTKNTSDLLRRWKEYATSFKDGLKAEPPAMGDAEVGLRNEKIKIDDFQDKVMTASRKVHSPSLKPLTIVSVLLPRSDSFDGTVWMWSPSKCIDMLFGSDILLARHLVALQVL